MINLQAALGSMLLPPMGLLLLALLAGLLAARRSRFGLLAALCALGVLLLSTPWGAGLLMASLPVQEGTAGGTAVPGAIIILGGDMAQGPDGAEVGRLTLERLRAGAALHRDTDLPILVTGGRLRPGQPTLAALMARSLRTDFNVPARWVEDEATDTRENARFAAALLRQDGIGAALLVTQSWHMPRAVGSFIRQDFPVRPAPARRQLVPELEPAALVPRADNLADSWYAIHEWAGRVFYALRDGIAAREPGTVS